MADTSEKRSIGLFLSVVVFVALLAGLGLGRWLAPAGANELDIVRAMRDPLVKREVITHLAQLSQGIWDTFPDPDVGRVLQVASESGKDGGELGNRFGLRERDFAMPKPPGVVRVVLLGDSFVYGQSVAANERLGVFLEEFLQSRAGRGGGGVEVLHVGLTGWNIRAETAFLRRQLSLIEPDLVVHVLFYNDLDDSVTARGFGAMARFSTQNPHSTDSFFNFAHAFEIGFQGTTGLIAGLDWESRERYRAAGEDVRALERAVTQSGARHLAFLYWPVHTTVAHGYLIGELPEDGTLLLPASFFNEQAYRVSAADPHWSRAGHERVARLLYGAIQERRLLPELDLAPWPEASQLVRELHERALRELADEPHKPRALRPEMVRPAIDMANLNEATARQIHAGVDKDGLVAPYASILLENPSARRLRVQGACLERPELDGAEVEVFLDELSVGRLSLRSGEPLQLEVELPEELVQRPFLSLRFVTDDWVYTGLDLRHNVSFRLERALLGP